MTRQPTAYEQRLIDDAIANLGVAEVGGANRGASVEVYQKFGGGHPGDPWCADFASYRAWAAAEELGIKVPDDGLPKTGSSSAMFRWFDDRDRLTAVPHPGCIGMVKGGPTGHSHTFIVVSVDHTVVHSVDGNMGNRVERCVHTIADCDFGVLPY